MPDEHVTRTADLAKAHEITERYGRSIGPDRILRESVAKAVADGIAFGRRDGIAMVAKDILHLKKGSNA
jgi:hypothetical protein